MNAIVLRLGGYSMAVLATLLILPTLASNPRIFSESGLIEWTQLVILAVAAIILVLTGLQSDRWRHLMIALAMLIGIAFVRELDRWIDDVIPVLGWKLPAGLIVVMLVIHVLRYRQPLLIQGNAFVCTLPMGILWVGFVMAVGIAQLIGDSRFLSAVMGDAYLTRYKSAIEETLELLGYFILCLGTLECWCYCRATQSASQPATAGAALTTAPVRVTS